MVQATTEGKVLSAVWERDISPLEVLAGRTSALPGARFDFPPAAPGTGADLTHGERVFLLHLQQQALQYFLDNQLPSGLVLDRQDNHGPRRPDGLCSLAATGMGFIALALAAAPPYRLLTRREVVLRLTTGLGTALEGLPHDHGILPHFVDPRTGAAYGMDTLSTVDSSWLLAGALWAAAFLRDPVLESLAARLYDRVDWGYWAVPEGPGLLRHGRGPDGRFLSCCWDRLNGETVGMYVLGGGAAEGRALPADSWRALRPFYGTVAGRRFNNADLGLFVFQYWLDLLDLRAWRPPGDVDLWGEARVAAVANEEACREAAATFLTYRRFWGLSSGDGPGEPPVPYVYRTYSPAGPLDGTAHLTATLASVVHHPAAVLRNLYEARHDHALGLSGRYGFSNVNLDRHWVSPDMVGIDAGAAVLALDNYLMAGRVRSIFHELPCVRRALTRFRFTSRRSGDELAAHHLAG